MSLPLSAATHRASVTNNLNNLQPMLERSVSGDTVILSPGVYLGQFIIDKPLTLIGETGAVIDAEGKGTALTLAASNISVSQLRIINWGEDLTELDAAIFIAKKSADNHIYDNSLYGPSFGIWVDAAKAVKIENNQIQGVQEIRSTDRGNGIHLFNVTQARVEGNEVWHTRDGIYIDTSNGNELMGNRLRDLRYGIHYMYSYDNLLQNNITQNTRTGYALMQSKYLTVLGNQSINDVNYGILMNYITRSTLRGNRIIGVQNRRNPHMQKNTINRARQQGLEGKALFIYNSLFNEFSNNEFSQSDIGIHLTAGSEKNSLQGNSFRQNKTQVKYVSTRKQDWQGNHWSDYLGWDMNGDGRGDIPYEPNDNVDRLLWKFPAAKLLLNSPAVETLRWVQRQFPVLKESGVVDSQPLIFHPEQSIEAVENLSATRKSSAQSGGQNSDKNVANADREQSAKL